MGIGVWRSGGLWRGGVVECRSVGRRLGRGLSWLAWFELVGGVKGVIGEWGGRSFDMVGSGEW